MAVDVNIEHIISVDDFAQILGDAINETRFAGDRTVFGQVDAVFSVVKTPADFASSRNLRTEFANSVMARVYTYPVISELEAVTRACREELEDRVPDGILVLSNMLPGETAILNGEKVSYGEYSCYRCGSYTVHLYSPVDHWICVGCGNVDYVI